MEGLGTRKWELEAGLREWAGLQEVGLRELGGAYGRGVA